MADKKKETVDYSKTAQEVLDRVYFGPISVAKDCKQLSELGITHLVTVLDDATPVSKSGVQVLHLKVKDDQSANLAECFTEAQKFIDSTLKEAKHRVLIHCSSGISRSGAVTLAYCMLTKSWSLAEAWKHVSSKRPVLLPNDAFFAQLLKYEAQLAGDKNKEAKPSMAKEDYDVWKLFSISGGQCSWGKAYNAYVKAGKNVDAAAMLVLGMGD